MLCRPPAPSLKNFGAAIEGAGVGLRARAGTDYPETAALRLFRQPGPTSFPLLARPSSAVLPMRAQRMRVYRATTVVVRAGHWPAPSADQMQGFKSADRLNQARETWPSVWPQSGFFALEQNAQDSLGHLMPCSYNAILKEFFYVDESQRCRAAKKEDRSKSSGSSCDW